MLLVLRRARGGACRVVWASLGEAQEHLTIAREIRIERDVEQAALSLRKNGGHACEWRGDTALRRHDAKTSGPFGDQYIAPRQEGHAPRILQSGGHSGDTQIAELAAHGLGVGLCGKPERQQCERARQREGGRQAQRAHEDALGGMSADAKLEKVKAAWR